MDIKTNAKNVDENKKPVFTLDGKDYIFRTRSIVFLFFGAPILSIIIYIIFCLKINHWIYDVISHQVSFLINLLFESGSHVVISPDKVRPPAILVPFLDHYLFMSAGCIAAPIFSFSIGFITCIPSPLNSIDKKKFYIRKNLVLIVSLVGIHLLNLIRMILTLYFAYIGLNFDVFHIILSFASAIGGVIFFILLLNKAIPEIFIGYYYIYLLVRRTKKFKKKMIMILILLLVLMFLMIFLLYFVDYPI
ncbi:MAG: hypothetical protein JW891_16380 [Candidatus Lokiarchaeota archaeon]|nr:hypothetical protein [Candidatus Lokiarchaeota archaeon]